MIEKERERFQRDIDKWDRYDFHQRGCYLEGLAGELNRGTVSKEFVVNMLESIASRMK